MSVEELRRELEQVDKLYYSTIERHSVELGAIMDEQEEIMKQIFLTESKLVLNQDYYLDGIKVKFVKVEIARKKSLPIVHFYKDNNSDELMPFRQAIHFWQLKKWVVFTGSSTETKS